MVRACALTARVILLIVIQVARPSTYLQRQNLPLPRCCASIFSSPSGSHLTVDPSLEIYFKDSRSLLVVFLDKERRRDIDQRLFHIVSRFTPPDAVATPGRATGRVRTPRFQKVFQKGDELSGATRRWQAREISNVCSFWLRFGRV